MRRIAFDFDDGAATRLELLSKRLGDDSLGATVERALDLLDQTHKIISEGGAAWFRDKDGERTPVRLA